MKTLLKVSILSGALFAASCGQKKEVVQPPKEPEKSQTQQAYENGLKSWVFDSNKQGYVTAVGIAAPIIGDDISIRFDRAKQNAYGKIAEQLEARISKITSETFSSQEENNLGAFTKGYVSQLQTKVENVRLSGVEKFDHQITENGTVYIYMGLSRAMIGKSLIPEDVVNKTSSGARQSDELLKRAKQAKESLLDQIIDF